MFLSFHIGLNIVRTPFICKILGNILGLASTSDTVDPRPLNVVTVAKCCLLTFARSWMPSGLFVMCLAFLSINFNRIFSK